MMIAVEHLTFTYPSGVTALRDVNLTIGAGETVAIIGENGAGKTTLVRHLNGLLKPGSGRVLIDNWDTREHTVARLAARVGYAFQNPDEQLFEQSVRAEVAFGPRNLGQSEADVAANVAGALEWVGLVDEAARHPYDLGVSQRKFVALAAILAMQTPVVVLDEPTTGQDARGMARLGEIVERLKASDRTVLAITHDIDFCADHFERVVVMADGEILADGPATEVLSQTALLARSDVLPPQLVRLAQGLGLPSAPLTIEAFINALTAHKEEEQ